MNPASLVGHLLEILKLNDTAQQPSDRLLSEYLRQRGYLGSSDRRYISDNFFGIIRHRRFFEALLEQYIAEHQEHSVLDHPQDRFLAIVTIYQLVATSSAQHPHSETLWKTTFPSVEAAAFIDRISGLASLEFLGSDRSIRLGVKYSFQDWMVEELIQTYGEETEQLLKSLNSPANISLRVNTLKTSREDCQVRLQTEGTETRLAKLSNDGLIAVKRFNVQASQAFKEGLFEIQDEGSQLIAGIVHPAPGQLVIDACAGAGGKSLQMAALMKNEGEIIAVDVEVKRLQELGRRAERAGAKIIRILLRGELDPATFRGVADIVLVDAPCSGSGTIRRNPSFKWSITESLVDHYANMQREILSFNAQFVKGGGRMVYVTCSLFRKENEDVMRTFLESHADFTNVTSSAGSSTSGMKLHGESLKLLPHIHDTDGFTIQVLQRIK